MAGIEDDTHARATQRINNGDSNMNPPQCCRLQLRNGLGPSAACHGLTRYMQEVAHLEEEEPGHVFCAKEPGAPSPYRAPDQEVVPFRASKLTHLGLLTKQRDLGVEL